MRRQHAGVTAAIFCAAVLATMSNPARAQFAGHNIKGDFGLQSGSQPSPGSWVSAFYLHYDADTLRDRNGNSVPANAAGGGALNVNGYAAGWWYVSEIEVLGANYGFMLFPGWTDNVLEVPILGVEQRTETGFGDLYIQPINLGWHTERADFIAGMGIFAPTGRYEFGGPENTGLGMWGFELFGGTTVFFGKDKSWHFAATAFYETSTKKRDTDIRVGDLLTVEGGLGKSFVEGALSVGAAYYAQWKVTRDDLGQDLEQLLGVRQLPKHRVFALGPEVTIPIATKKKLIAFLDARYLWETGARTTLEGTTFVFSATFPIPSIPLH